MFLSYASIHDFMFSKLFETMPKCTEIGTILTFMPASPQVAKCQMLELLLHNISDNYKFCSAIFNAKIVIKARWHSFPYFFFFFLHIVDNSGRSRGEFLQRADLLGTTRILQ